MNGMRSSKEPPPPYSATPTNMNTTDVEDLSSESPTSLLQAYIKSLPGRVRAARQASQDKQATSDALLLDCIRPLVEEFLVRVAAVYCGPLLATLTLVPGTAVPKSAVLSGSEEMDRRGDISRVARVTIDRKGKDSKSVSEYSKTRSMVKDPYWASGRESSDWGRLSDASSSSDDDIDVGEALWWQDEDMARRLASYLQPNSEKRASLEIDSVIQAVAEQRMPSKFKRWRGWWEGSRARNSSGSAGMPYTDHNVGVDKWYEGRGNDDAEMAISAQKVAFRHENDFGLLESLSGWGIIVAVRVR
ncbi:hypothetical protein GGR52DRAFT_523317 [Hypoxylon sp. FL1284]|nr:hypothetical protein GGR52DRAFT_523317 [Hypoxylon sp. FL1284]